MQAARRGEAGARCWRCDWLNAAGAATCARCHAALSPRSPLSEARRQADQGFASEARGQASSTSPRVSSRRRRTLTITLTLAAFVGLAGFGAVRAAELLQHALRPLPGPADIANTACTAYSTQNYVLLTQQIDPAPVPPSNSDPFNPAVVQTQLRALDKIQGAVQRCDLGHFTASSAGGQYPIILERTQHTGPITVALVLHQRQDGSWKISRETNFAGALSTFSGAGVPWLEPWGGMRRCRQAEVLPNCRRFAPLVD
jgi:hypothetical protein